MKATFENTVDILVKAYLNGFLESMECACCAVGNIVAYSKGFTFNERGGWNEGYPMWQQVLFFGIQYDKYFGQAKDQIESTGYTPEQLLKIEKAFMRGAKTICHDGDNFTGLMNIVDVLAEIHGIDLTQKEEAKLLFVKA